MCTYLNGSTVHGCVYSLMSHTKGVQNKIGRLKKGDIDVKIENICNYEQVLAHDWVDTTRNGSVHLLISVNGNGWLCSRTKGTSAEYFLLAILIIVLGVVL